MNYEEIIDKIEEILESSKPSFGNAGKIKVDAEAIHRCLEELSSSIPNEIIQARKIVAERRDILQAAQTTASKIISEAQDKAAQLTEESEITKSAKDAAVKILNKTNEQAAEIIDQATDEAGERVAAAKAWSYEMRSSTIKMATELLSECTSLLTSSIDQFTQTRDAANAILGKIQKITVKTPEDQE